MKDRLASLPVIGTAMAVQERTKADAADQFGAAIAFHGFVSLFPLIAVVAAVTGFVLSERPAVDTASVLDSIQQAIPGLEGDTIDKVFQAVIDNAASIGLIAFVGALYTGLRVTKAAQTATQFVLGVNLEDVSVVKNRGLQLLSLVVLGTLVIASVAVSGWVQSVVLAADVTGTALGPIGAWLASAAVDVLLFWVAYRLYATGSGLGWRALLPGAVFGGVGWALLKYFGGAYLASQADSSVVTGGGGDGGEAALALLATMIGLLLVFYIAGRLYVYGAELSAELAGVALRNGATEPGAEDDADEAGGPDPVTSGRRAGLLAALEEHERRRGLASPPGEEAGAARALLFDDDDGAPGDGAPARDVDSGAGTGSASEAGVRVAARSGGSDDGLADTELASGDDQQDGRGTDGPDDEQDGDDDEQDGGDVVVTVRELAGGTVAGGTVAGGTVAGGAADDRTGASEHHHAVDRGDATTSGADAADDTALVPWRPEGTDSLLADPTSRRVAGAAAVGLVGLAVAIWRRRSS